MKRIIILFSMLVWIAGAGIGEINGSDKMIKVVSQGDNKVISGKVLGCYIVDDKNIPRGNWVNECDLASSENNRIGLILTCYKNCQKRTHDGKCDLYKKVTKRIAFCCEEGDSSKYIINSKAGLLECKKVKQLKTKA
ncbi:MAG: hypothetical protein HQK53_10695 [Oligoflexia bacterium]|nr:hypothetical protein [Oligoflexia bacterium]